MGTLVGLVALCMWWQKVSPRTDMSGPATLSSSSSPCRLGLDEEQGLFLPAPVELLCLAVLAEPCLPCKYRICPYDS